MSRTASWLMMASLMTTLGTPAARGETFQVNDRGDRPDAAPGDGACEATPGRSDCTLRAAVQEANALRGADAIEIPAGVFALALAGEPEDRAASGDLDLTDSVRITGAGRDLTVLDGAWLDRVFDVPTSSEAPSVTIARLTIRHGARGGLRSLAGGALVVSECEISENVSPAAGGGLYASGGSVTVLATTVRDNEALMQGGGIRVHRAALRVEDSEVHGNTVRGSAGGGIHASSSTVALVRTTVSDNAVAGGGPDGARGGGLYLLASDAWIESASIIDNQARSGAGVHVVRGSVTAIGSSLEGVGGDVLGTEAPSVTLAATPACEAHGRCVRTAW